MLKRILIILAILAGLLAPVHAAGTVPGFSLTPQFDLQGKVAPGCKLYVYQAGTVASPQNAYQDTGLTNLAPNPLLCDATGRLPQWFVADGTIKLRLTDKNGIQIFQQDNLLVVGPSSGGGGGGGTVDPTTIFQTGDVMWSETDGTRSGWVRDNGRTIGSASSGATERANADTEALFNYLWQNFDNTICPVSGGRGVSSAADWAANKTIATPDKRGYIVGGLDTMGNAAAGRWANAPVIRGNSTTVGSILGEATHTLTAAQIPAHTHPNTLTDPGHTHGFVNTNFISSFSGSSCCTVVSNTGSFPSPSGTMPAFTGITINNAANTGGGGAHNVVQPTVLGSFFRKL
jgi:microcystin-dependent protein